MYSLYLYFLGLSLRNTSKALIIFKDDKRRSYVSVWNWIQRFDSCNIYKRKRVSAFIIDETVIQVGSQHFWLWFCIEPILVLCLESTFQRREICLLLKNSLDLLLTNTENIQCIQTVVHGTMRHVMYLRLKHYLHSPFQKSLMERVNQYFKDRTESFDDYYPCMQDECNLFHVYNWIQFFVSMYNDTTFENYFINELNERGEYILN